MALSTVSESQGLKKEQNPCWKIYTGTAEQIIAAGLARAEQFPGAPGRGKTHVTYYAGKPTGPGGRPSYDENYLSIRRYSRHKFVVYIGNSTDESAQFLEAANRWNERQKRDELHRQQRAMVDKELAEMPSTHEQYRKDRILVLDSMLQTAVRCMTALGWSGYSYSNESIQAVKTLTERIRMVLRNGDIIFDPSMHSARIDEIKAKVTTVVSDRPALRLVAQHRQEGLNHD